MLIPYYFAKVTASTGAQSITFNTAHVPRSWLVSTSSGGEGGDILCDFFDIFDSPHRGKQVGRMSHYSAIIPPHGVKFLLLSNCNIVEPE
eukprot:SAG31_NODE_21254_length_554_cov_0.782418_1_plen_90_part_00